MTKNQEQRALSSAELAGLLGLSAMSIGRLTEDGVLTPIPGKRTRKFPMDDSVRRYVKHLRDKLANRSDVREALAEANLIKAELQARKMEVELSLIERNAHATEDVRRVMNDMLGSFRAKLWAFPNSVADRFVNVPDRDRIIDMMREEIASLCTILADYSPEQFYARNSDYLEDDEGDGVSEDTGQEKPM